MQNKLTIAFLACLMMCISSITAGYAFFVFDSSTESESIVGIGDLTPNFSFSDQTFDDILYRYNKEEGVFEVVGPVIPNLGYVYIRDEIDGFKVTKIQNNAFSHNLSLLAVTLGSNIIEIGESAFENCHNLTDVLGIQNLVFIRDRAFYNCIELITSLNFTAIQLIGADAFRLCVKIPSISITLATDALYQTLRIGDLAFHFCQMMYGNLHLYSYSYETNSFLYVGNVIITNRD